MKGRGWVEYQFLYRTNLLRIMVLQRLFYEYSFAMSIIIINQQYTRFKVLMSNYKFIEFRPN